MKAELLDKKELARRVEKPYTFDHSRKLIKGRFGSLRTGSKGSLNPLEVLHFRLGHKGKGEILRGLRYNAYDGAQTTYDACKNLRPP